MGRLFVRQTGEALFFLFFMTFGSFALLRFLPGDPVLTLLNIDELSASPEQIETVRRELGFHEPLLAQYIDWLSRVGRLDLGESFMTGRPVLLMLGESYRATFEIAGSGLVLALLLAVPLGTWSARSNRHIVRLTADGVSLIGAAVPSFWIGLVLTDWFAIRLPWLPVTGRDGALSIVLPAVSLSLALASVYIQLLRVNLQTELAKEYIQIARARGLSEQTIFWKYAFRGSLPPVLAVFTLSLGSLAGGVVVLEVLFAYPGVGKLMVDAVLQRDYPLIQGYILLTTAIIVALNVIMRLVTQHLRPDWRGGGMR
ncbi:ABC transporter permease [Exiguobacterium undae]|uniref:ABC transporter permease n=1 Tax=Exiguobacterium undae TaxID=169177 RepID=UPI00047A464E|nr:ABC transporter permease [Exiguobacterium undae]